MRKTESYEAIFEHFLAQRYRKEFHIIDHPSITFSLAQIAKKDQLKWVKQLCPGSNFKQKFTFANDLNTTRSFYMSLHNNMASILSSLFKCLQQKKLDLSEFFQYSQAVLNGFFNGFLDGIRGQCRQKAEFIEFAWSQNSKIVQRILKHYSQLDYKNEMSSNLEIRDIHLKYSSFFNDKFTELKQKQQKIVKLEYLISVLVNKIRAKRKQSKKLERQGKKLLQIINQFKDKNLELENRYLCLVQSHKKCTYMDIQEFEHKKQKINSLLSQILTIGNTICKPSQEQQMNFDSKMKKSDFIKQASELMNSRRVSDEEITAQIDIILDRYEQTEKPTQIQFTTKKKRNGILGLAPFLENQLSREHIHSEVILQSEKITCCTQTQYDDKIINGMIKCFGVNVKLDEARKIRSKDKETQCSEIQLKQNSYRIIRTVDLSILSVLDDQYRLIQMKNFPEFLQKLYARQDGRSMNSQKFVEGENFKINGENQIREMNYEKRKSIKQRFSLLQKNINKMSSVKKKQQQIEIAKQIKLNEALKKKKRTISVSFLQPSKKNQGNELNTLLDERPRRRKQGMTKNQGLEQSEKMIKQDADEMQDKQNQVVAQNKRRVSSVNNKSNIRRKISKQVVRSEIKLQKIEELKQSYNKYETLQKPLKKEKVVLAVLRQFLHVSRNQKQNAQGMKQVDQTCPNAHQNTPLKNAQQFIEFIFKKALQTEYRNCKQGNQHQKQASCTSSVSESSHKRSEQEQIRKQVISKIKSLNMKNKKIPIFLKHKNMISIIFSTYARAYFKITQFHTPLNSLLDPLFECLKVVYGKMNKEEMNKKMINFIVQAGCKKNDQACKSFCYMLGIDDQDISSQHLTSFQLHLYLTLLKKLSLSDKPFDQTNQPTTTLSKMSQNLSKILKQSSLSEQLSDKIIKKIKSELSETMLKQHKQDRIEDKKLNLLSTCLIIIKQIMNVKCLIKDTFKLFVDAVGGCEETVRVEEVRAMILLISSTRIEEMKSQLLIQRITRKNQHYFHIDQFTTAMLALNIQNFEQFYIRALMKFGINTTQKRAQYLTISHCSLNRDNCTQQIMDILLLKQVQKRSNQILEYIIGPPLVQLFGLSILIASQF